MSAGGRTVARGWCRVDLAGGTLDIWPLGLFHPGACTVNLAIDLAVTVALEPREQGYRLRQDGETFAAASLAELRARQESALVALVLESLDAAPMAVELRSESPRGGGLGASSALVVALIAAADSLQGQTRRTPGETVALARDLEARLMGLPTGVQDHYPALLGGALAIHLEPGGERVEPLEVDLEQLGSSLVVAYTGQSHFSAGANWTVVRRRLEADSEITALFSGIAEVAQAMVAALKAGDFEQVGRLMAAEWSLRRQLSPAVPTEKIEELLAAAVREGAWGGKACGAGGGGSIALLCPPERRGAVASALEMGGAQILSARPTALPLAIEQG